MKCCKNDAQKIQKSLDFLKVINESNRLKILCLLKKDSLCACDIWTALGIPQNLASHHLRILQEFDLIDSQRDGRKIIYSSNRKIIMKHTSALHQFLITDL